MVGPPLKGASVAPAITRQDVLTEGAQNGVSVRPGDKTCGSVPQV
jgi:hypothetical protein